MIKITSRQVVAIGITPRIDEFHRDRVQEFLDGTHPMSPERKKYDSGTKRKTVLDQSPVGPAETGGAGDRLSHDNVGSGYDAGLDPGGPPDDETGPGFTSKKDKEQRYTNHDTADLAFKNDFDTSSKWSPLNWESEKRDHHIVKNLDKIYEKPLPDKRVPVDKKPMWRQTF
jgi:hypothetical protein